MPKQTESVVIDVAETTVAQPEASCASQLPNTAPEKQLNLFVRVVASVERAGNALGTLAFTWATVVLLGGYPTSVNFEDFVFATTLFFLEAFTVGHGWERRPPSSRITLGAWLG
jgi:hypothetical protein